MTEAPLYAAPIPPHLLKNTRVLANRESIFPELKQGGVFVEVGVALGDFTEKVLSIVKPSVFIAIDLFNIEEYGVLWNRPVKDYFGDKTHLQFYSDRFAKEIEDKKVRLLIGESISQLSKLDDKSVDVFYVDAGHLYEEVKQELEVINTKIKDDGLIIMNDYIYYDHAGGTRYGVVQATNEFMINEGWEMSYLALNQQMYCDVGLRRHNSSSAK